MNFLTDVAAAALGLLLVLGSLLAVLYFIRNLR